MARETRAGHGPAVTPEAVERVVVILARRAVRADMMARREKDHDRRLAACIRHETYLQAIAELLGVPVGAVRRAFESRSEPFTRGATRHVEHPPTPPQPPARAARRARPARHR